jgi:hypothetical protein
VYDVKVLVIVSVHAEIVYDVVVVVSVLAVVKVW